MRPLLTLRLIRERLAHDLREEPIDDQHSLTRERSDLARFQHAEKYLGFGRKHVVRLLRARAFDQLAYVMAIHGLALQVERFVRTARHEETIRIRRLATREALARLLARIRLL